MQKLRQILSRHNQHAELVLLLEQVYELALGPGNSIRFALKSMDRRDKNTQLRLVDGRSQQHSGTTEHTILINID